MLSFALITLTSLTPQGSQAIERFPAVTEQDARHYDLSLRVDLDAQRLSGQCKYTFTAIEQLTTIRLNATRSDSWKVAFRDNDGLEMKAKWSDSEVTLTLPKAAEKGTSVQFTAAFAGKPADGFYFKKNRYGELMAFTDHYSIRARGWLPCEDHPGDRAKFSVTMTYPEGNEAVGFGLKPEGSKRKESEQGMQTQVLTGMSEIPPYMFALVVGPLARVSEAGDKRLVDHLVYKQDVAKANIALVNHAAWIAQMEQAFGTYPYGKYMTVQCPTRWGGFEAPGNVQLAESLFDNPERCQSTLAHELVHMWFGDAVGYSEWREVWLSEGFASYFGPWLHAQSGGPTMQQSMLKLRTRWASSFEGRTKSIRDNRFPHPDQALNSNTYPKGAWVLHMLRGEVGDQAFFKALKTYVETCRGNSIVTEDFVVIIERETNTELSWFFSQWLDGIGCPELKIATNTPNIITIEQVQQGMPYTFWLRLGWQDEHGKAVQKRIRINERQTDVPFTGTCTNLQLDPEVELLFRTAK